MSPDLPVFQEPIQPSKTAHEASREDCGKCTPSSPCTPHLVDYYTEEGVHDDPLTGPPRTKFWTPPDPALITHPLPGQREAGK